MTARTVLLAILTLTGSVAAQESAGYQAREHVLNAGGHPAEGITPTSASYRISLDSLGDGVVWARLASPSFRLDGGSAAAALPPGEVTGLRWTDRQILVWDREPAAFSYGVYRGALADAAGPAYGDCALADVAATLVVDTTSPSSGEGFFYLITARNGLNEQGPKGRRSDGSLRAGNVCP
jgi:hypothetical protein